MGTHHLRGATALQTREGALHMNYEEFKQ
jgi:hypothetical protein